jgi:hypothetical protein
MKIQVPRNSETAHPFENIAIDLNEFARRRLHGRDRLTLLLLFRMHALLIVVSRIVARTPTAIVICGHV